MGKTCELCGKEDLFSAVTGDGVCAPCQLRYFGGLQATPARIANVKKTMTEPACDAMCVLGQCNRLQGHTGAHVTTQGRARTVWEEEGEKDA